MNFNKHSDLEGQHAFLSASKYHWINYDTEKLSEAYSNFLATKRGTEFHELAKSLIEHGVKLPRNNNTFNSYVNDAISFKMTPEQPLYYSSNCFGTADSICFRQNMLRIHDLKTGVNTASIHQLEVYAALFCLEYGFRPEDISIELRIYQNNEVMVHSPAPNDISEIMEKIVCFDKQIEIMNSEE